MQRLIRYSVILCLMMFGFGAMAAGDLGLGVMIGGPTGISGNYWLQNDRSIDAAIGAGLGRRELHIHSTYLIHFPNSINLDEYNFGWYVGGGARLATQDKDRNDDDDETLFGPRGSAGLNFPIKGSSGGKSYQFDAFAEFAMTINFVSDVDADVDFGLGGRYYF